MHERNSRSLGDALEALSRASVAEMLREMGASLSKLAGCSYLSQAQERHVENAARHINAAIAGWIEEVMSAEVLRIAVEDVGTTLSRCSGCPECPRRISGHVATMLDIYDHDFGKREFTPMQLHCLMVAIHNLVTISKEIVASGR